MPLNSGPPKRDVHPNSIPPSPEQLRDSVGALNLSIDEIAELAGCTAHYIMQMIHGQVPVSLRFCEKLERLTKRCE